MSFAYVWYGKDEQNGHIILYTPATTMFVAQLLKAAKSITQDFQSANAVAQRTHPDLRRREGYKGL